MNIRFLFKLSLLSISIFFGCKGQADKSENQIVNRTRYLDNDPYTDTLNRDSSINHFDSLGRKQGLWMEEGGLKEAYYQDDLKHGIYRVYFATTGKLEALGEFENNQRTGTWYYFDEKSLLYAIENDPDTKNNFQVKNDEGKFILLPFHSYLKLFNDLGNIQEEGIAVYDESIQIDFYKYGIWKCYDESGKFTHEENYKEGKIYD